ncbi:MAG TPA: hypothetical protein VFU65_01185 [Actinocrinis sp.]|nr:hypothetical protein [Actinocrinis sp.]
MSGTIILAIVLAVVVVLGAAVLIRRTGTRDKGRDLRRRFGPEYDRVAAKHGDPAAAEQELAERVREHDALTLRPLEQDERERYERTWTSVQERFIDDPRGATQQADQVIGGLLTAIGYPSEDREKQLDLASVDHAYALSEYRQARELAQRGLSGDGVIGGASRSDGAIGAHSAATGTTATGTDATGTDTAQTNGAGAAASSTETLREALLHYRVMFNELLGRAGTERAHAGQR